VALKRLDNLNNYKYEERVHKQMKLKSKYLLEFYGSFDFEGKRHIIMEHFENGGDIDCIIKYGKGKGATIKQEVLYCLFLYRIISAIIKYFQANTNWD
jgi:hypothetical protein